MAYIETLGENLPQIYAYTTPGIPYHEGWTKIGDTRGEFKKRIGQQTSTAGIIVDCHLLGFAIFEDGSNKIFRDHAFHQYLLEKGVNNQHPGWSGDEWFQITVEEAQKLFDEFRKNPPLNHKISQIILREEQEEAISQAVDYHDTHKNGEFLWNAKPRFGKTISAMEFCKRIDAHNILILTNKPAVANSWYEDYLDYLGPDSGYIFVSSTPDLKNKKHVLTREEYAKYLIENGAEKSRCFEFVSMQDLKGSIYYGGTFDKLRELEDIKWDAVFVDEAHEGIDTIKSEFALDRINRKFTLHLSGTPFKQIKNEKFDSEAIFNWTYVDEQEKKENWAGEENNPYEELPKLNMYTYRMSNLIEETKHANLDEAELEYAYKLNKFFETKKNKAEFIHRKEVLKFLDALTTDPKFPMSSKKNRELLAHSFWLLPSVDAADAMQKELEAHPIFKEYKIVNVAGNNLKKKNEDEYENENQAYGMVRAAIENNDKTITLSVMRLTTGVTIPEWTSVLILSEMKSAQSYMQAAFRAQNPCVFKIKGKHYRKNNSYVFDFNPERSLSIIEQFANDLYSQTSNGRGSTEERKNNIEQLLKYLPVAGEDEKGNFSPLSADQVLSIPRAIRCTEVVRCGFMCNFLFANDFSGIFRSSKVVTEILNKITVPKGEKSNTPVAITPEDAEKMHLNASGEVEVTNEEAEQSADQSITTKEEATQTAKDLLKGFSVMSPVSTDSQKALEKKKQKINDLSNKMAEEMIKKAKNKGTIISPSIEAQIKKYAKTEISSSIYRNDAEKESEKKKLNNLYQEEFAEIPKAEVEELIKSENDKIEKSYQEKQEKAILNIAEKTRVKCSKLIMKESAEKEKKTKEDEIRSHLKGFARTIPSFLMAYGNENTTLETFEKDIPANVFLEVTSISIKEFVFLRDGGDSTNEQGEIEHFDGNVFEPTVFNDSVKAFLMKKQELSNYFHQTATEDIFDYIPPQKTNQIFTPKKIVQNMIDLLEKENPGCFNDDSKTFIDLYMKSGLYIAEIVKRLFRSPTLIEKYPDDTIRLQHIFEKQVYGLAPTEIIYQISKNFILGFDVNGDIKKHNLKMLDSLPYAENGTLEQKLDEVFPPNK